MLDELMTHSDMTPAMQSTVRVVNLLTNSTGFDAGKVIITIEHSTFKVEQCHGRFTDYSNCFQFLDYISTRGKITSRYLEVNYIQPSLTHILSFFSCRNMVLTSQLDIWTENVSWSLMSSESRVESDRKSLLDHSTFAGVLCSYLRVLIPCRVKYIVLDCFKFIFSSNQNLSRFFTGMYLQNVRRLLSCHDAICPLIDCAPAQ